MRASALVAVPALLALVGLQGAPRPSEVPPERPPERPRDPWVFRCVLDGREDMLVVGLHRDLWLGYDLAHGRVYGAWAGGISWAEGRVATEHGELVQGTVDPEVQSLRSHPLTWGVWGVAASPQAEEIAVALAWTERRHRIEGGRFVMSYALVLPDGARVEVEESPEFLVHPEEDWPGMERRIRVRGLPDGRILRLVSYRASVEADHHRVVVSGPCSFHRSPLRSVHGEREAWLQVTGDGTAVVTTWFGADRPEAEPASAQPGETGAAGADEAGESAGGR